MSCPLIISRLNQSQDLVLLHYGRCWNLSEFCYHRNQRWLRNPCTLYSWEVAIWKGRSCFDIFPDKNYLHIYSMTPLFTPYKTLAPFFSSEFPSFFSGTPPTAKASIKQSSNYLAHFIFNIMNFLCNISDLACNWIVISWCMVFHSVDKHVKIGAVSVIFSVFYSVVSPGPSVLHVIIITHFHLAFY